MKKILVNVSMVAALVSILAAVPAEAADWDRIGRTTVVYNDEVATIKVKDDMACSQLKLSVAGKWIKFEEATIHFADGSTQKVDVDQRVEPGMDTDPIEVDGGAKTVKTFEVTYKPVDGVWSGRTNVSLLGTS